MTVASDMYYSFVSKGGEAWYRVAVKWVHLAEVLLSGETGGLTHSFELDWGGRSCDLLLMSEGSL